jgi:hypothetical protein
MRPYYATAPTSSSTRSARSRSSQERLLFTGLVADLRGAAADVERRTSHQLCSYVLFTNIDLTIEQHERLRTAILDGITDGHVQSPLSVLLISLRCSIGCPICARPSLLLAPSEPGGESWDAHERAVIFPRAPFTGRDQLVTTLRAWLDDPDCGLSLYLAPT